MVRDMKVYLEDRRVQLSFSCHLLLSQLAMDSLIADIKKATACLESHLFSEHLGGSSNLESFQDLFCCVLSLPSMLIHCLSFQLPGNDP